MPLKVYTLNNLPRFKRPIFIMGSFESFHLGHKKLLEKALFLSQQDNFEREIILIYFADTQNLPKNSNQVFCDEIYRLEGFLMNGVLNAIQLKYNEISQLSHVSFIDKLITNQDDFDIVSGDDFRFGNRALGDINYLASRFNNNYHCVQMLKLENNQKISTSFLKELALQGEIEVINMLNCFKFGFNAFIQKSSGILFLDFDDNLTRMQPGIYAANIEINKMGYYCLLLVKKDNTRTIEMIDFDWTSIERFHCKIIIHKLIRPFYKNSLEETKPDDFAKAKEFFIEKVK
ncbi:riboflavin kinase [Mycoplasmopsis bovigenitalium]|uniref:FAD synthase n=1 Tax=Mycoplasmopsis bovigenitalium TaxID=2112 RepID=A0A449A9J7_9BACT|nr:riboflavin biosynthesis protein [Mycoplasmopsis bovigenitalium]VEU60928.1 riboflavin kinase [Mycoplasmopsis bovigenitalium]